MVTGNQDLVHFPQMWSMKTEAMNTRLITNTGTGPLKRNSCESQNPKYVNKMFTIIVPANDMQNNKFVVF